MKTLLHLLFLLLSLFHFSYAEDTNSIIPETIPGFQDSGMDNLNWNGTDGGSSWLQELATGSSNRPHHRSKRFFGFPAGSNLEAKWSLNFPFDTFTFYKAKFQLGLPIKIPFPAAIIVGAGAGERRRRRAGGKEEEGGRKNGLQEEYALRRKEARMERIQIYQYLQGAFESAGLEGRSCLLRAICEVAEAPFDQGIVGEMVNTLLTASVAGHEEEEEEEAGVSYHGYLEAELQGRLEGRCQDSRTRVTGQSRRPTDHSTTTTTTTTMGRPPPLFLLLLLFFVFLCSQVEGVEAGNNLKFADNLTVDENWSMGTTSLVHSRKKRYLAIPVGSNLEIKWAMNFPFNTFTLYRASAALTFPIKFPIPDTLILDDEKIFKRDLRKFEGRENILDLKTARQREDRLEKVYLYTYLEKALLKAGLEGRSCVLRAICEAAEVPFDQGLLGEMMNTLLTPSRAGRPGEGEEDYLEYVDAEIQGRARGQCGQRFYGCTESPFDYVTDSLMHMS